MMPNTQRLPVRSAFALFALLFAFEPRDARASCSTPQGVLECGVDNLTLGQPADVEQCGLCPSGQACTVEQGACPAGELSCCVFSSAGACETGEQECLDPTSRLNLGSGGAEACTNDELSLNGLSVDGVPKKSYPGQDACTGQDFSCGTCPAGEACDDQALGEGPTVCPPGFGTCCLPETPAQRAAVLCFQNCQPSQVCTNGGTSCCTPLPAPCPASLGETCNPNGTAPNGCGGVAQCTMPSGMSCINGFLATAVPAPAMPGWGVAGLGAVLAMFGLAFVGRKRAAR